MQLGGVGLDVFPDEPAVNPRLFEFPNATLLASRASGAGVKQDAFIAAVEGVFGVPKGEDVNAGDPRGVWVTPLVSPLCSGGRE